MSEAKNEPDQLAKDVSAAIAAGMSYGKWKAMQDPVNIYQPKDLPEGWKLCAYCGKPFKIKSSKKQMYCDIYCQRAAQKERDRQKKGCAV